MKMSRFWKILLSFAVGYALYYIYRVNFSESGYQGVFSDTSYFETPTQKYIPIIFGLISWILALSILMPPKGRKSYKASIYLILGTIVFCMFFFNVSPYFLLIIIPAIVVLFALNPDSSPSTPIVPSKSPKEEMFLGNGSTKWGTPDGLGGYNTSDGQRYKPSGWGTYKK